MIISPKARKALRSLAVAGTAGVLEFTENARQQGAYADDGQTVQEEASPASRAAKSQSPATTRSVRKGSHKKEYAYSKHLSEEVNQAFRLHMPDGRLTGNSSQMETVMIHGSPSKEAGQADWKHERPVATAFNVVNDEWLRNQYGNMITDRDHPYP